MTLHHTNMAIALGCAALLGAPVLVHAASLSKTDAQFMKTAATDDMIEAHLGQMAEAQAAGRGVKDFGQKLSDDHTKAYEQLSVLANQTGEAIPKGIGHEASIAQLTHLKGARFDRAFLVDEAHVDEMAIARLKNETKHGENTDLKNWAQNMIPTFESDLQTARTLEKDAKR